MGFILTMNELVKSKKVSDSYLISQTVKNLIELLNTLDRWINETPPIEQPQRFGNKAFRTWFSILQENAEEELKKCLDQKFHKAIPEVYLQVMRKLQLTYRMEPAGSHGVWSLDDHQFIPFIWGSAQLIGHPRILPKSFIKEEIYENFSDEYIFLACIKYINQVKTGPFHEHSNQLWNIAGVPNWNKVNSGLIKMYRAEVLDKFPVIQHFLFGSLMSIEYIKS
ncbi:PPP2R4 [Acanthosepion pharaonis]|uniref:Serine/threonine-protein phosphatase 2A activator n=1 Tax=Acanthosepion pharaonis TaxID=158019 RepID=A0A812CJ21_ACAPH|nr:PPP2R4 [Sepia pharaonis]